MQTLNRLRYFITADKCKNVYKRIDMVAYSKGWVKRVVKISFWNCRLVTSFSFRVLLFYGIGFSCNEIGILVFIFYTFINSYFLLLTSTNLIWLNSFRATRNADVGYTVPCSNENWMLGNVKGCTVIHNLELTESKSGENLFLFYSCKLYDKKLYQTSA